MWDYLIFLAYLKDKEKTEYSAAESYINDMVSDKAEGVEGMFTRTLNISPIHLDLQHGCQLVPH